MSNPKSRRIDDIADWIEEVGLDEFFFIDYNRIIKCQDDDIHKLCHSIQQDLQKLFDYLKLEYRMADGICSSVEVDY